MKLIRLTLLLSALLAGAAVAQNYPVKSPRLMVGFAPGGGTDLVARIVAQKLGELWGQTVVVDNRPGASGMIAAEMTAKAPPDGYTLMITPQTSLAVAPALYGKAPYDTMRDFTPITLTGYTPLLMVVHPSFPVKNFKEFIALAKKSKEPITFGSGGVGSSPHMAGELMASQLGIKITHVPYKGENPALADTVGGQIPIMFGNLPVAIPHVQSGRLRGIANTWSTRSPLAPEIATVAEAGFKDYDLVGWFGLWLPAGAPPELVARLYSESMRVLADTEIKKRFDDVGLEAVGMPTEAFARYAEKDAAEMRELARKIGLARKN
jgi:tripartite-type tricarboxylate transporter receptor subunit TctC